MADQKISELTAATALAPTDLVPVSQGPVTNRAAVSLFDGRYTTRASTTRAATKSRTSGDIVKTLTQYVWTDLEPTLDLTITAAAGDRIMFDLNGYWGTQAVLGILMPWTLVSGSRLNNTSALGQYIGLQGVASPIGGAGLYTVAAADVVAGEVTFRLGIATSTAGTNTKSVRAIGDLPFRWMVVNLG